jgi:hypothetical protein
MACLERFYPGQRVQVVDETCYLFGRRGTVKSLNVADRGAIVAIQGGLPDTQSLVVEGEGLPDHTVLYPEQCERV